MLVERRISRDHVSFERSGAIFDPREVLGVSPSLFRFITFKRSEMSNMMYEFSVAFLLRWRRMLPSRDAHIFYREKCPRRSVELSMVHRKRTSTILHNGYIWLRSNMSICIYINMNAHRETSSVNEIYLISEY